MSPWHIVPNIQNDSKCPNIKEKTTIWWPRYKMAVIGVGCGADYLPDL
jgi:hypothetical protein